MLNTYFIPDTISYDGQQLASHWIYHHTGILDSTLVAFLGPCDVRPEQMVDQVDLKAKDGIYSTQMLHLIGEIFMVGLGEIVALQRLVVAMVAELINCGRIPGGCVQRKNDDLFYQGRKLSVSIATVSPVSGLFHLALNVHSEGTPIPTSCLTELKISPEQLAKDLLLAVAQEVDSMRQAACKVRGVS